MENEQKKDWCMVKDEEGKRYRVRIRKLTPKECFRLMGVTDENADKMLGAVSKSQAYKQAGNSIVVDNMLYLFESLFYPVQAMKRNITHMAQRVQDMGDKDVARMYEYMKASISKKSMPEPAMQEEKNEEEKPRVVQLEFDW